eukprot:375741-Hanusia_phi.AAC.1
MALLPILSMLDTSALDRFSFPPSSALPSAPLSLQQRNMKLLWISLSVAALQLLLLLLDSRPPFAVRAALAGGLLELTCRLLEEEELRELDVRSELLLESLQIFRVLARFDVSSHRMRAPLALLLLLLDLRGDKRQLAATDALSSILTQPLVCLERLPLEDEDDEEEEELTAGEARRQLLQDLVEEDGVEVPRGGGDEGPTPWQRMLMALVSSEESMLQDELTRLLLAVVLLSPPPLLPAPSSLSSLLLHSLLCHWPLSPLKQLVEDDEVAERMLKFEARGRRRRRRRRRLRVFALTGQECCLHHDATASLARVRRH